MCTQFRNHGYVITYAVNLVTSIHTAEIRKQFRVWTNYGGGKPWLCDFPYRLQFCSQWPDLIVDCLPAWFQRWTVLVAELNSCIITPVFLKVSMRCVKRRQSSPKNLVQINVLPVSAYPFCLVHYIEKWMKRLTILLYTWVYWGAQGDRYYSGRWANFWTSNTLSGFQYCIVDGSL